MQKNLQEAKSFGSNQPVQADLCRNFLQMHLASFSQSMACFFLFFRSHQNDPKMVPHSSTVSYSSSKSSTPMKQETSRISHNTRFENFNTFCHIVHYRFKPLSYNSKFQHIDIEVFAKHGKMRKFW